MKSVALSQGRKRIMPRRWRCRRNKGRIYRMRRNNSTENSAKTSTSWKATCLQWIRCTSTRFNWRKRWSRRSKNCKRSSIIWAFKRLQARPKPSNPTNSSKKAITTSPNTSRTASSRSSSRRRPGRTRCTWTSPSRRIRSEILLIKEAMMELEVMASVVLLVLWMMMISCRWINDSRSWIRLVGWMILAL